MAKKIRVYELARELGLTNKEALDLCGSLGIGVRSHSSSIEDAQADRARRKADREGLRRDVSPPEPVKGGAARSDAAEPAPPGQRPAPEVVPGQRPPSPVPSVAAQVRSEQPVAPTVPTPATPAVSTGSGRDPRLIVSRPTPPPEPLEARPPIAAPRPAAPPVAP
ncbi:MAG: translation initiation factor IF-2 N-terminal domain-containing protein, partial [Acidimicrobiales bacterium]